MTEKDDFTLREPDAPEYAPGGSLSELLRAKGDETGDLFERLFTPPSRAYILGALVEERGDPMTAEQIAAYHEDLSITSVHRHRKPLMDLGVIKEAGKDGKAQMYAIDVEHPVAQVLAMLDNLYLWGATPQLLNERFIFENFEDVPE